MLDVQRIRQEFPALQRTHLGTPIIYLDNACTTLKPTTVIEAMSRWYTEMAGCHGRSSHLLGRETTNAFEEGRATVARFIGARFPDEVVFTKSATESINLVAHGLPWTKGDQIVVAGAEHNSTLVPLLNAAHRHNLELVVLPTQSDLTLHPDELRKAISPRTKLVALHHVSNLTGARLDVAALASIAHSAGALLLVDGAQAVPHSPVDLQALDADFYAFSAHKMLGPPGLGVLYAKRQMLKQLQPSLHGGGAVESATYQHAASLAPPHSFEAGTQNYPAVSGLVAAISYIQTLGYQNIATHIASLNSALQQILQQSDRIQIMGPQDPAQRAGICNFHIRGLDSLDMARMLDSSWNIMLRAGAHCAHSWYSATDTPASIRASMYLYNTVEEVEFAGRKLLEIARFF